MSDSEVTYEEAVKSLEAFVADNDDLSTLEEIIGRFNIFDALGIVRAEIRHSNFLAWLLDPAESHGQSALFLKAVLFDLIKTARDNGFIPPVSAIDLDGATLQGVEIRREWRNIDILIKCDSPKFVIAIENKVDAGPANPFEKYESAVRDSFAEYPPLFVYLTRDGDDLDEHDWTPYSYRNLHRALSRTRQANETAIGDDVLTFLDHYIRLIGSRFMDDPKIDELCEAIYKNHRQALDLIYERAGSPRAGLIGAIEEELKQQPQQWYLIDRRSTTTVTFMPKNWLNNLPPIGRRPRFDSRIWLVLEISIRKKACVGRVRIWPTSDAELRRKIVLRLIEDENEFGFRSFFKNLENIGQKWTTLRRNNIVRWPEDNPPDEDKLLPKVRSYLDKCLDQLADVPDALHPIIDDWESHQKKSAL